MAKLTRILDTPEATITLAQKEIADLLSRGWAILLIEFIIYGGSKVMNKFFARGLVVEILPRAKQNAVSQTSGQWLKKMRRQDRIQTEVSRAAREELRRTKQHRLTLIKKYRLKSTHIKNDAESKTKLMASVNKKVVSLALTVDGLMNRIHEKRFILDRQREDNKRVLQRYEQLYNDIQNRYIYE
ncbi:uncharacterized protein LOC132559873 [Ylistrum balloti]|uniref:uncharacterized protein LOC132559873 n=1 Tax=Ylistrum balloti TaxID=509963 RepID=UPI002905E613|nr:uncharacterized protein LOC132559873 [Ylistrum balloti]